ncbi:MAG: hypothetical protein JSS76_01805 [Bacteroidetes bacterium]|nr:hypothetical protein [Bacteroidota bacterium]
MIRILLVLLCLTPIYCRAQPKLIDSDATVRIRGTISCWSLSDRNKIDSVFGSPDSIYTPLIKEPDGGYSQGNRILCYPNAAFVDVGGKYEFYYFNFSRATADFFVDFGSHILTCNTTIADVRNHFLIWPYENYVLPDPASDIETLVVYSQDGSSDPPIWRFDFRHGKLVKLTFVPMGA